MAGKGKRYELSLKKKINEMTHSWVKAHRPDFSGSSVGEVADLMVVWQADRYSPQRPSGHPERFVTYIELKKRSAKSGNRATVMAGSSNDQSGLEELQELRKESPAWTGRGVAVKFQNRELIVLDATVLEHWLRREQEGWGQDWLADDNTLGDYKQCEDHGARLTPSDNISMVKPELDYWPSSKAGKQDGRKLLHSIGVEDYDIKEQYLE